MSTKHPIEPHLLNRLRTAWCLLHETSGDDALFNDRCDRAHSNVCNAMAHIGGVLKELGHAPSIDAAPEVP